MFSLYESAMIFAVQSHNGQVRKGTCICYVTHPLAVAEIVRENGGSKKQIAGALLHDVVEDGDGLKTLSEIRELFGKAVSNIVLACSDSTEKPKPEWWERKKRYIAHIAEMYPAAILVSLADKVHNANAIEMDLGLEGLSIFERFTTGQEGTLWYYRELVGAFKKRGLHMKLVGELDRSVTRIESLTKLIDPARREIIQKDAEEKGP